LSVRAVVGVDIGTQAGKAVGCTIATTGEKTCIVDWTIGRGDQQIFAREVVKTAKKWNAVVVAEVQYVRFPQAAIKLVEARMWVKVLSMEAGLEYEEVVASAWQGRMLRLATTKATKNSRWTKVRAAEAAGRIWPTKAMSEDQIDAALIAMDRLTRDLRSG